MDYKLNIRDRRGDNRYFIDNAFLKNWGAKLGPHCVAVYSALAMYANADTQEAWPSFQTIADLVGMSRRQVMREIDKLKANNIIRVEDRKEIAPESGKSYFLSNVFTLLHPDEWGKSVDICLCEGGDTQSLGVVTDSHQPSDTQSPTLVTHSHPNNTNLNNTQLTTDIVLTPKDSLSKTPLPKEGASKPTRPPTSPTAKILVEETGKCYLNTAQLKITDQEVGNTPEALDKWRESVRAWNLNGCNPKDAQGMLDWFRTGKRSKYNGKDSTNGQYNKPTKQQRQPSPLIPLTSAEQEQLLRIAAFTANDTG